MSNDSHLYVILQLIHPKNGLKLIQLESSQLCAATLTHYSTESQTTRPDYDTCPLLISLASDGHPRIYGRFQCNRFVRSATSMTGTLNELTTMS